MKQKWMNIIADLCQGRREGATLVKPYGAELATDALGASASPDKYLALMIIGRFVPELSTPGIGAELAKIRAGHAQLPHEIIGLPEISDFFRSPNLPRTSSGNRGAQTPLVVHPAPPPRTLPRSQEIVVRAYPESEARPSGAPALQWLEGLLAKFLPTTLNPPKSYATGLVLAAAVMVAADGEIEDSEVYAVVDAFRRTREIERTIGVSVAIRTLKETLADLLTGNALLARRQVIEQIASLVGEQELRRSIYLFAEELSASNSRGKAGPDEKLVLAEIARALAL